MDEGSTKATDTDPGDGDEGAAAKDRFRAALERKRDHQHPHEAASRNGSKLNDAHRAAGGKRQFRRKSG